MLKAGFKVRMTPAFSFCSRDQVKQLHLAALEVLERTGFIVRSAEARALLKEAGCHISSERARVPAALIKKAVESAPPRVVLADTDGNRTVFLEGHKTSYGITEGQPLFYDPDTCSGRESKIEDSAKLARVADALEHISFITSECRDEGIGAELRRLEAIRRETKKPLIKVVGDQVLMQAVVDTAMGQSGNRGQQKSSPHLGFSVRSDLPLSLSDKLCAAVIKCAELGLPLIYNSAVTMGKTGPATLAGSLALATAGLLGALVIHQLKSPGAPFVMQVTVVPGEGEGNTARLCRPEVLRAQAAAAHLAHFYNLPSSGLGGGTDTWACDQQAATEATFSIQSAAFAGINLVQGCGSGGDPMIGSPGQMIMADEIIAMTGHFMKGVELSEETVPLDLIDRVGAGGEYVTTEHTFKHFKEATWYPRYMNRSHFTTWQEKGAKTMGEVVNERARELIGGSSRGGLLEAELEQMALVIARYEKG